MKRVIFYIWAMPCSLIGMTLGFLFIVFGGSVIIHSGILEFTGGGFGQTIKRLPKNIAFCAITFGHTVLAVDRDTMEIVRAHEQVHVRQYERWGILFFAAYLLSSLFQLLTGRHPYFDNYFEREARAKSAQCPLARFSK